MGFALFFGGFRFFFLGYFFGCVVGVFFVVGLCVLCFVGGLGFVFVLGGLVSCCFFFVLCGVFFFFLLGFLLLLFVLEILGGVFWGDCCGVYFFVFFVLGFVWFLYFFILVLCVVLDVGGWVLFGVFVFCCGFWSMLVVRFFVFGGFAGCC